MKTLIKGTIAIVLGVPHVWAATVSGSVDHKSGGPAPYIRVTITCPGHKPVVVYTGKDGVYYGRDVPPGSCKLDIGNTSVKEKPASYQIDVRDPSTQVPKVQVP